MTVGLRQTSKEKHWNRCDSCGRFISKREFEIGMAYRRLVTPDTAFTEETFETCCGSCREYHE